MSNVVLPEGLFTKSEVIACALLELYYRGEAELNFIQSEDPTMYTARHNITLGLGHLYAPEQYKFDYHQDDFTSTLGVAGLVWENYGYGIIRESLGLEEGLVNMQAIHAYLYKQLFEKYDQMDHHIIPAEISRYNRVSIESLDKEEYTRQQAFNLRQAVNAIKPRLENDLNYTLRRYVQYTSDLNYISTLIEQQSESYLVLDRNCPCAIEVLQQIDPTVKIKVIIYPKAFSDNVYLIVTRGSTKLLSADQLKQNRLMSQPEHLINVNKFMDAAEVQELSSALEVVSSSLHSSLHSSLKQNTTNTINPISTTIYSSLLEFKDQCNLTELNKAKQEVAALKNQLQNQWDSYQQLSDQKQEQLMELNKYRAICQDLKDVVVPPLDILPPSITTAIDLTESKPSPVKDTTTSLISKLAVASLALGGFLWWQKVKLNTWIQDMVPT